MTRPVRKRRVKRKPPAHGRAGGRRKVCSKQLNEQVTTEIERIARKGVKNWAE